MNFCQEILEKKTALCWDGGIFDLIMKKTNQYWLADRLSVCRRKVEEFSATAEFQTENTETENLTWDSVNRLLEDCLSPSLGASPLERRQIQSFFDVR